METASPAGTPVEILAVAELIVVVELFALVFDTVAKTLRLAALVELVAQIS